MKVPVSPVSGPGAKALAERIAAGHDGWDVVAPAGCPCCTGRVELQVMLTRLLRARRPARLLLVVPDREHLPALERTLCKPPLADYVEIASLSSSSP